MNSDQACRGIVPANWPPIVPEETFHAVQQLLAENEKTRTNQGKVYEGLPPYRRKDLIRLVLELLSRNHSPVDGRCL